MQMLKHNSHKVLLVLLSCFLLLILAIPAHAAAPEKNYPNGMLTSPPPAEDMVGRYVISGGSSDGEISIQGAFNPSHLYLDRGATGIGKTIYGTIAMDGTTFANQYVQQVGVRLTLQRWTGSYWTDVYYSSSNVMYNTTMASWTDEYSAVKGYYYRTMGTHWVDHYGVHEEGIFYGASYALN